MEYEPADWLIGVGIVLLCMVAIGLCTWWVLGAV